MNPAKQLFLGLIALGLSTPAFADAFVYEPDQRGGWKAALDILYLSPSTSDLVYATKINRALPLPPPDDIEVQNGTISPDPHWGLYAQIGYLFPCGGNDLTLGYTYLPNNATIDSMTANPPLQDIPPFSSIIVLPFNEVVSPGGVIAFSFAQGQAKFNLNALDIEAGQRFTTDNYDMRMFAGLRYANIDHSLKTLVNTPSLIPTQPISGNQEFDSQFSGWGPRVGVDARYCFGGGFGIDANVSSALLVSHIDASYQAIMFVPFLPDLNPIRFQTQNNEVTRLVPVLEAKMGIDYAYTMSSWCNSSLVFEFGYQLTNYFNAIDRAQVVAPDTGTIVSQGVTADVGFDGFYLGVKYYG